MKHLYCVSICHHKNVPTLTSPPILKLLDSQGYLACRGNKANWSNIWAKKTKKTSILNYCHSFQISVIPNYCLLVFPPLPSSSSSCHCWRPRKLAARGGHICEFLIIFWKILAIPTIVGLTRPPRMPTHFKPSCWTIVACTVQCI